MSDTYVKVLDLAEELIRSRGYDSFSYKDISSRLAVKNAAIHYHFPTKADLGKAVVTRSRKRFREQTEKWKSFPTKLKIQKFIGIYETSFKHNLVCFMGALGPSYETLPSAMQAELTEAGQEIRNWLSVVLTEGREKGEVRFMETIEEKADMIVSSLLASLILSRVTKEKILKNVSAGLLNGL